jgi:hypothetical protein
VNGTEVAIRKVDIAGVDQLSADILFGRVGLGNRPATMKLEIISVSGAERSEGV